VTQLTVYQNSAAMNVRG